MRLTLSRKVAWGEALGTVLPTRYEERSIPRKAPAHAPTR